MPVGAFLAAAVRAQASNGRSSPMFPPGVTGERSARGQELRDTAGQNESASGSVVVPGAADRGAEVVAEAPPAGSQPQWQWEHKTGFKDYSRAESDRIEKYYQDGRWMMRMKSGTGRKARPREIYFVDMLQYDPASENERKIRRVPSSTRLERLSRNITGVFRAFMTEEEAWWRPKPKSFYEKRRRMAHSSEDVERDERYRVGSVFYRICRSWQFGCFSLTIILMNSWYIWVDADYNTGMTFADTPCFFIVADNAFTIWFTVEVLIRGFACKSCRLALKDSWLVFDILLVLLMIFETWLLQVGMMLFVGRGEPQKLNQFSMLRGLRLLRLARITRLFKVFPQLFVLVKGMALAMKSLFYTLTLLFVLIFVFGVVLKNFNDMTPEMEGLGYESVGSAMWIFWVNGTLLDNIADVLGELLEVNRGYAAVFMLSIFLSNLTMLNMLIGVLCDVITRVSNEQQNAFEHAELHRSLTELLESYDVKDDRCIGRDEFRSLMTNPDFRMILKSYNIDVLDLARMEDVLFESDDGGTSAELPFDVFLEKVFQLRGGNTATVTDMVELRNYLNKRFNAFGGQLGRDMAEVGRGISTGQPRTNSALPPETAEVEASGPDAAQVETECRRCIGGASAPSAEEPLLPGQVDPTPHPRAKSAEEAGPRSFAVVVQESVAPVTAIFVPAGEQEETSLAVAQLQVGQDELRADVRELRTSLREVLRLLDSQAASFLAPCNAEW